MRKLLLSLAVVAIALAVSAPHFASAAKVKITGIWRFRGITTEDSDRNSQSRPNDSKQEADALIRPRWTFTTLKGKIKAIYEIDFTSGGLRFGGSSGRQAIGLNRWTLDFAIPGTKLRARLGKSDWRSPDKELMGGAGLNRVHGYGIYGKLTKGLKISLWNTQLSEGRTASSDNNAYFASLSMKPAPALTLTPWIGWEKHNAVTTGGAPGDDGAVAFSTVTDDSTERDIYQYGLNVKAKFGRLSLNLTGVIQAGKLDFGRAVNSGELANDTNQAGDSAAKNAPRPDVDIDAYAILIRSWLNLGSGLKIGLYATFMPGDDDPTDAAGDLGTQFDNKLTRYTPMHTRGGQNDTIGSCRINGPQLVTTRRYHSFGPGYVGENRCGNGDGGVKMNGSQIIELLWKYKVTKKLSFNGNISSIRTAAKRADEDTDFDGIADGATFDDSKNVGTEFDVNVKYSIYKGLTTGLTYSHLFAGDYGKSNDVGTRDFDDTWALVWELKYVF